MESVKILIANTTMGSGKSTLSLALAHYINNQPAEDSLTPILVDCSDTRFICNKRNNELNSFQGKIPPFEILSLPVDKQVLFTNSINLIFNRDAIYLFDLPSETSQTDFIKFIPYTDFLLIPFIMTYSGICDTARFLLFIKKSILLFNKKKIKGPEIILIPNMIPREGMDPAMCEYWAKKKELFSTVSAITPEIKWRDNLMMDLSTIIWHKEFQNLFSGAFNLIYNNIDSLYKERHSFN